MDERRHNPRHATTLVMEMETLDGKREPRLGITRDASTGGLLLGTSTPYATGQQLVLVILKNATEPPVRVKCEVVRCRTNPDPSSALWLNLVAVRFTEEVPGLEALIEEAITAHEKQEQHDK